MQAERKSSTSTLIPDLDNANVGTYKMNLREIPWCISFYFAYSQDLQGRDQERTPLTQVSTIEYLEI